MATLSELRTLIAAKLADENLIDPTSAQIDAQINSTIEYYETDAFWFSEEIAALNTVVGDPVLGGIPSDFKQIIIPNGLTVIDNDFHYPLIKLTPLEYEARIIDISEGLPRAYTFRKGQFELWRIPDQIYTVNLFYRKKYADLVDDGDDNDFTINAPRLIEYKTIADCLRDYRSDEERALMYDRRVEVEYNQIKTETQDRTATGTLTTENMADENYYFGNYYGYYF